MPKPDKYRARRGRKRRPMPEQGRQGGRSMPRSMGLTFEYIRRGIYDLGLDEFARKLQAEPCPFPELRENSDSDDPKSRISAYELAERHMAFGTQHKYATLSGTYTGVIHVISLFYALLRCAANEKENEAELRDEQMAEAVKLVRKLRAMVEAADELVTNAKSSGLLKRLEDEAWIDPNARLQHELLVMKPLFDAFRGDDDEDVRQRG